MVACSKAKDDRWYASRLGPEYSEAGDFLTSANPTTCPSTYSTKEAPQSKVGDSIECMARVRESMAKAGGKNRFHRPVAPSMNSGPKGWGMAGILSPSYGKLPKVLGVTGQCISSCGDLPDDRAVVTREKRA